jgi:hypothetical protein
MSGGIPERDWRVFRELRTVWLERYCQRVNSELLSRLSDERLSAYEWYLKVYRFIVARDRKLGEAFNDFPAFHGGHSDPYNSWARCHQG